MIQYINIAVLVGILWIHFGNSLAEVQYYYNHATPREREVCELTPNWYNLNVRMTCNFDY
jgi:hypothetical protein